MASVDSMPCYSLICKRANGKRKWLIIHIGIDAKIQEIVAESTPESGTIDGKVTTSLLDQVKGRIRAVLADGAYDSKASRKGVRQRGARALIPPPCNGRLNGDEQKDNALRIIKAFGGGKIGRPM